MNVPDFSGSVPHLDRTIRAPTHHQPSISGEADSMNLETSSSRPSWVDETNDLVRVACKVLDNPFGFEIPNPNGSVCGSSRKVVFRRIFGNGDDLLTLPSSQRAARGTTVTSPDLQAHSDDRVC